MSQNQLHILRDQALQLITEGKTRFNNSQDIKIKQQGQQLFVQGITQLYQYSKQEQNQQIQTLIKQKLDEFATEAEKMKKFIDQNVVQQSQSNNNKIPDQKQKINDEHDEENKKLESALSDAIVTEKPNIKWTDIAGLENAKTSLKEAVLLPIKFPQFFQGNLKPWKGILLYGPPGTGKTLLAKACATECEATFFSISSSDLISKWVGESEKLIKTLFAMARKARPAIIFIDEIDSLLGARTDGEQESTRRVKTEFLVQMQGVGKDDEGILCLGATNIPWGIDSAVRRRFEKRIYIPLPDITGRRALIQNLMNKAQHNLSQNDIEYIAQKTEGYSGSDMATLVRDASFQPLRKCQNAKKFEKKIVNGQEKYFPCAPSNPNGIAMSFMDMQGDQLQLPNIEIDDFEVVLVRCKSSVSEQDIERHIQFTKEYGQDG